MLQPRKIRCCFVFCLALVVIHSAGVNCTEDGHDIEAGRVKRQNHDAIRTVLLVDNDKTSKGVAHAGRFLRVSPTLGLVTETARTFIEGDATTEYATRVLGTTLADGRLYAHLLTTSSRVIYSPKSSSYVGYPNYSEENFSNIPNKPNLEVDELALNGVNFIKNIDYVSPNKVEPYIVYPTTKIDTWYSPKKYVPEEPMEVITASKWEELPAPFAQVSTHSESENENWNHNEPENIETQYINSDSDSKNIFTFKANPLDIKLEHAYQFERNSENDINGRRTSKQINLDDVQPDKVKQNDALATFTIGNMFSPSGYANDVATEKTKLTTIKERKPKVLLSGGKLVKQDLKEFDTVTYFGFADFTTTVGDTVIVFSPSTSTEQVNSGRVTIFPGDATIPTVETKSTKTTSERIATKLKTFYSHDPGMITKTVTGHKLNMETSLPTMVIDATNREPKSKDIESPEDREIEMKKKMSVLAHEQDSKKYDTVTMAELEATIASSDSSSLTSMFTEETIQPSETQMLPMLSTPSEEEIAKFFSSLAAKASQTPTEPLSSASSITVSSKDSHDDDIFYSSTKQVLSGYTTIFIDDIFDINSTSSATVIENKPSQIDDKTEKSTVTTNAEITTEELFTTNKDTTKPPTKTTIGQTTGKQTEYDIFADTEKKVTLPNDITTTKQSTTIEDEVPTEKPTTLIVSTTTEENDVINEIQKPDISCSNVQSDTIYKTYTYFTTFFIPIDETSETTSIKSHEVTTSEINYETQPCSIKNEIASISVDKIEIESSSEQTTTNEISPTSTDKIDVRPTSEQTTIDEISSTLIDKIEVKSTLEQTTVNAVEENPTTTSETSDIENKTDKVIEFCDEDCELTTEHLTTIELPTTNDSPIITTPLEIVTERKHITDDITTEISKDGEEEIELVYKTLYTTYTYLTTFFQESTSSVSSRKVVITNVISSTLDNSHLQASDPVVAGLFGREDSLVHNTNYYSKPKPASFEDFADIVPTNVDARTPTTLYPSDKHVKTPILDDSKIKVSAAAVQTYYTTYTYFTTVFIDGETEVSSRTEVYTNYVTPAVTEKPLKTDSISIEQKYAELEDNLNTDDEFNSSSREKIMNLKIKSANIYNSTIIRSSSNQVSEVDFLNNVSETDVQEIELETSINNDIVPTQVQSSHTEPTYSTMKRKPSSIAEDEEDVTTKTITDVRSSSSDGERRIIDNVEKRNIFLEDQISSESNNDSEIMPSPTLLLQTSYTTFTYFTTMYLGTTASSIVSRLETVTNVVTETLTPTRSLSVEDSSLPITYFTTFTYWTTFYKDGTTTTTSREETISNVITPSVSPTQTENEPSVIVATPVTETINKSTIDLEASPVGKSLPAPEETSTNDNLTTYYTTYTYYTTSYVSDSTVVNSRLETVTNIVNSTDNPEHSARSLDIGDNTLNALDSNDKPSQKTDTQSLLSTGLLSTIISSEVNDGTTTILSTGVYGTYIDGLYAKVKESTTQIISETIQPTETIKLQPTGTVSINQGKIVDADGVSTLFYTTKAIGTYIDNLYAQVIESTSSLLVDEVKKSALPSDIETRPHRTGLVRLIEGAIVQNRTTTIYQSKVVGTVIEGRYAQIIESTSSFIIEKTKDATLPTKISPTETVGPTFTVTPTASSISPSPVVIESSLTEDHSDKENDTENEDEDEDGNTRTKSRLGFTTRRRTFTPVIRPFVSRGRPTFAPKPKKNKATSATTITRSDFTPTITATPTSRPKSTRGRFGRPRQSSSIIPGSGPSSVGDRRYAKTRPTSSGILSSSAAISGRGRSQVRIQPTSTNFNGATSRRGGFRNSVSSQYPFRSSNIYASSSRFRGIRPTLSSGISNSFASKTATTQADINDSENDLTTVLTDRPDTLDEEDFDTTLALTSTTEASTLRRTPFRRFPRPLNRSVSPASTTPRGTTTIRKGRTRLSTTTSTTTTTTPKPKAKPFSRPPLLNIQNVSPRQRPANNLFPPRGLFKPRTTTEQPKEEEEIKDEDEIKEEEVEEEQEDNLEEELEEDDNDYESSNTNINSRLVKAPNRNGRAYNPVQVRPFGIRKRTKRQADYGSRSNFSRFRRPTPKPTAAAKSDVQEDIQYEDAETPKPPRRYSSRQRTTPSESRISPTRSSNNQGRSQFTLREKDSSTNTRSNFRRPSAAPTSSSRRTASPTVSRPKAPRLRSYSQQPEASRRPGTSKPRTTSRSRTTQRARGRNNDKLDYSYVPPNDGTITVTHHIPTEITIPVVNGKLTEYKNIVTAKPSTEVLGPSQYSTTVSRNGAQFLILTSEATAIGGNGATEITQFILNETPTTGIIFTPTYIRGRKTSFSHVIPSTVYNVEQVVSTIQPALAAQAPLANILLSQLLLGNLGLPNQNPLLALNQNPVAPATPTTEYKTRSTTYVTTVTKATSTVVPLTYRGQKILTTIVDSSEEVVTATEFITDTIVVTPTPVPNAGLNSLLLPLLLQQQQQQQVLGLGGQPPLNLLQNQEQPLAQALFQDSLDSKNSLIIPLADFGKENENLDEQNIYDEEPIVTDAPRRKASRKKPKKPKQPAPPPKETSIITLYVSGRRPGEFSTVLSTVIVGEDSTLRKRAAEYFQVQASVVPELYNTRYEYTDSYLMPAINEINIEGSESASETESLESIVGDVSKYIKESTPSISYKSNNVKSSDDIKLDLVTLVDSENKPKSYFLGR